MQRPKSINIVLAISAVQSTCYAAVAAYVVICGDYTPERAGEIAAMMLVPFLYTVGLVWSILVRRFWPAMVFLSLLLTLRFTFAYIHLLFLVSPGAYHWLRREAQMPNKAPEPTPTSVMPRAIEGEAK